MGEMADAQYDDFCWSLSDPDGWECDGGDPFPIRRTDSTKWQCKNGTVMNVKDMTDAHIHNAIDYANRIGRSGAVQNLIAETARRRNLKNCEMLKSNNEYAAFCAGWKDGYNSCANEAWPDVGGGLPIGLAESWENFSKSKMKHEPKTIQRSTTKRVEKSIRRN